MLRPQMPYQHYYRWNPKGFLSLFPKEVYESFSGRGNPTLTPHPTGRAWRRCSMKHFLHIVICCFFCPTLLPFQLVWAKIWCVHCVRAFVCRGAHPTFLSRALEPASEPQYQARFRPSLMYTLSTVFVVWQRDNVALGVATLRFAPDLSLAGEEQGPYQW